jgi:hypothetical protein
MMNRIRGFGSLALQVNPAQVQESLDRVKDVWQNAYPEHLFTYEFLDEQIREFYETEQKMSVLFGIFSAIAIFIGCLGLFGLATFLSNQKTKEVGVRKVLGASVESIIFLFSKEYIKLILVGFAFSAPLGWFAMNKYLDTFAYKVPIGVEVFIVGLVVTMAIALLTVGYKSPRETSACGSSRSTRRTPPRDPRWPRSSTAASRPPAMPRPAPWRRRRRSRCARARRYL